MFAIASPIAKAEALSMEDYFNDRPQALGAITPLEGGETYATKSADGKRIDIISFKTGKKLENFSISILRRGTENI